MSASSSSFRAHRQQHQYAENIRNLVQRMRVFPEFQQECHELESAVEGIVQPFEVAIFGRMKTGKSSILNALLGHPLTITGVNEATATINRISYGIGEQLNSFRVHWKDFSPETMSVDMLQEMWTGTGEDTLRTISRTSYLELYSDASLLKSVNIIDTPGTGSVASEHEAIAQQFIGGQETDALIYVFSPVGRETDEQDLRSFRDGCLPSSSPYNSVALLHKWDALYWDNGANMEEVMDKAKRLEQVMSGLVSCVLPVSAPLAFIAKRADEHFWQECEVVLSSFAEDSLLSRALNREDKWSRNPQQAELYQKAHKLYDMPWASFRVMLRHLYRIPGRELKNFAAAILELSGFSQLNIMLDRQFFMHSGVIKQRQIRARVVRILKNLYAKIESLLAEKKHDFSQLEQIEQQLTDKSLKNWVSKKLYDLTHAIQVMQQEWISWDRQKRSISEEADLGDKNIEAQRWLASSDNVFSDDQTRDLNAILDIAAGFDAPFPTYQAVRDLNRELALLSQSHNPALRKMAEYLQENLKVTASIIFSSSSS